MSQDNSDLSVKEKIKRLNSVQIQQNDRIKILNEYTNRQQNKNLNQSNKKVTLNNAGIDKNDQKFETEQNVQSSNDETMLIDQSCESQKVKINTLTIEINELKNKIKIHKIEVHTNKIQENLMNNALNQLTEKLESIDITNIDQVQFKQLINLSQNLRSKALIKSSDYKMDSDTLTKTNDQVLLITQQQLNDSLITIGQQDQLIKRLRLENEVLRNRELAQQSSSQIHATRQILSKIHRLNPLQKSLIGLTQNIRAQQHLMSKKTYFKRRK